jgi:murein L,D-transpeptidase YafK
MKRGNDVRLHLGRRFVQSKARALFTIAVILVAPLWEHAYGQTFKSQQMRFTRVRAAFAEKEKILAEEFKARRLHYPPKRIFIRVFKVDRIVEVWCADSDNGPFQFFKHYHVCAVSGDLGPKRVQGDAQIPEGFYYVEGFNPFSNFHLSLKVNYPNESDRILGVKRRLGGDIFIHGDCVTIGCVPITDDKIKELYVLAVEARSAGQRRIPIHIFPTKMDFAGMRRLQANAQDRSNLWVFWTNVKEGFDFFDSHRRPPAVSVNSRGSYVFQ